MPPAMIPTATMATTGRFSALTSEDIARLSRHPSAFTK